MATTVAKHYPNRLRRAMEARGQNQNQAGAEIGLDPSTLSRFLRGKLERVQATTLGRIAEYCANVEAKARKNGKPKASDSEEGGDYTPPLFNMRTGEELTPEELEALKLAPPPEAAPPETVTQILGEAMDEFKAQDSTKSEADLRAWDHYVDIIAPVYIGRPDVHAIDRIACNLGRLADELVAERKKREGRE